MLRNRTQPREDTGCEKQSEGASLWYLVLVTDVLFCVIVPCLWWTFSFWWSSGLGVRVVVHGCGGGGSDGDTMFRTWHSNDLRGGTKFGTSGSNDVRGGTVFGTCGSGDLNNFILFGTSCSKDSGCFESVVLRIPCILVVRNMWF